MKQDLFFDAMDYIDDDMIEAVDALRTKKKPSVNRTWIRWASAAACVCIVLGGVFAASRYGWFDRVEMEDAADHEMANGNCIVHSYVCVTVDTGDQNVQNITDIRDVTAVYDILQIALRTGDVPQEAENTQGEGQAAMDGEDIKSESISDSGSTVPQKIEITFITADNKETIYFLEGTVLTEQHSGKSVVLSERQIKELWEIMNVE